MTDLSFYNNPDLADGFGSLAGGRKRRHGGLDFAHGKGKPIPALFSGTVVTKGISEELGAYTQIRRPIGKVDSYCHSDEPSHLAIGETVRQGERVNYVSDRGYATGPHLHIAVGNTLAIGHDYCEDPLPWVRRALAGEDNTGGGYDPAPAGGNLGPVLHSGSDWAYRDPQGELANRISRALIARGRLAADYKLDGLPGPEWRKGVQRTLVHSGVFASEIDGDIRRGGSYGVQDYAIAYGSYRENGGSRDGRPEVLSWSCFALGLERP